MRLISEMIMPKIIIRTVTLGKRWFSEMLQKWTGMLLLRTFMQKWISLPAIL